MTAERETTRVVRSWLREDEHESAEHILTSVLDRLDTTPQRRHWWSAWRLDQMNIYAKLIAGAAAALLVAFVGYQFLPGRGGFGGQPTSAPSPTPSLLARGTFTVHGINTTLDASGAGPNVSGSMTGTNSDGAFTVDLHCERTINGLRWIGGDVTQSTSLQNAPVGSRTAIVLKPGPPVQAVFVFQMTDPRSATCLAFFDDMIVSAPQTEVDAGLEAIAGTVELAP